HPSNIQNKLIIVFIFLSIISLLPVGIYAIISNVSALKKIAAERVMRDVITIKEKAGNFLTYVEQDLRFLSESYFFKDLLEALESGEETEIAKARSVAEERILQFALSKRIYYQIRYLDELADEIFRVEFDGATARIIPQNHMRARGGYYFFMVDKLREGELTSAPVELKSSERSHSENRSEAGEKLVPAISYAMPIFSSEKRLQGILIANVFAKNFFSILEQPASKLKGSAILVSKEGFYLYHPDKKKDWGTLLASRDTDNLYSDFPPEVTEQILSGQSGATIAYGDQIISYAPLFYGKSKQDNFYVVLRSVPKSIFFASVKSFERLFFILVAFSLFVAVALGYFVARHFTSPIKQLMEGSEIVGAGNFAYRLKIETNDEIKDLAENFNRMASAIQEREERILRQKEQHAAELSQKLEQRTRELNDAYAQLMQSEKLAAIGKLAAGVAHEINNPIGIILSRIECLMLESEENPLNEELLADLNVISKHAHRVSEITGRLLTFARHPPSEVAMLDINAIIEELLLLTEKQLKEANIHIEKRLAEKLPKIEANNNQLQQVLLNLLSNAQDAMPQGGKLTIQSELSDDGQAVQTTIADTGTGIPKEHQDKLFEPFFTTKERGTGLGLSVSYGIIKEHGGSIDVKSEVGKGTTFIILLPIEKEG
ncbi:MAG: ATP-binding protein, partial [Candidatus Poribacteria bacterium]